MVCGETKNCGVGRGIQFFQLEELKERESGFTIATGRQPGKIQKGESQKEGLRICEAREERS